MSELRLLTTVQLPPGQSGGFNHADVDPITGRVFVAHTAFDTIDVIDIEHLEPVGRIDGCPEGSGVISATGRRMLLAAARGASQVLAVDPDRLEVVHNAYRSGDSVPTFGASDEELNDTVAPALGR